MGVVHFLAMSGMADELRAALALLSDFDIDAKRGAEGQKKTALMCAAAYGQLSNTRLLIELGADVTPCSSGSGLNALQLIATTSRSMAAARTAAWARSKAGALALAEAEEGVRVHELYGALSADDLCTQTWKEVDDPGRTREDVIRVAIQACEKHISSRTWAGVKQVAMLTSLERAQTWLERARGFSELEWAVDALDAESLVAQLRVRVRATGGEFFYLPLYFTRILFTI